MQRIANLELNQHQPGKLEAWGAQQVFAYAGNTASQMSAEKVTRLSLFASFMIGFWLTVALVLVEVFYFPDMMDAANNLSGLAIFIVANIVLVGLEFYLLFKIGFYCVAAYVRHSGLDMTQPELKLSLSRAILEIPEPGISRLGLDPYQYRRKSHYVMLILYKMKTFATSFLAKLLVRKLLARTGFRAYSSLVAAPVTGFWDAWVMAVTLREARTRIAGRAFVLAMIDYFEQNPALQEYLLRLVAVRVVIFEEYNVNLDYLIAALAERRPDLIESIQDLSDMNALVNCHGALSAQQKTQLNNTTTHLFALKRKKLSENENKLLAQLVVENNHIKSARQQLDQFQLPLELQAA